MPALVLFGHRTALAGDDLRVFTVFALILRLLQAALLIPVLILFVDNIDEEQGNNTVCAAKYHWRERANVVFYLYWTLAVILVIVAVPLELLMYVRSEEAAREKEDAMTRISSSFKLVLTRSWLY